MKVFDFDNTLYDGECSLDFFLYCLKKKKSLIKYLPTVTSKALKYKTGIVPESEVYEFVNSMLKIFFDNCENLDRLVQDFWKTHRRKLKDFMLKKISPEDAIISASPRFLLDGVADRLNTQHILCTEIDMESQTLSFLCYSQNKVHAFTEAFGDTPIEVFYTDNMNDMPLIQRAEHAVLVKGSTLTPIQK